MTPSRLDRSIVIWIGAALVVWTCCLVELWALPFDASGASTLLTAAITLLALSVAIRLPGRVVRATQRVLGWIAVRHELLGLLAGDGLQRSNRREVKALLRLLAVVTIFAAVGGLAGTAAIFAAAWLIRLVTPGTLLSPAGWWVLRFICQFVGMFPIALGMAVVFLTTGMLRAGLGRDPYAAVLRDWLWAVAVGFAVFAACWELGANLLGMSAMMFVALIAAAMGILLRRRLTLRPGRVRRPIETPAWPPRVGIAVSYGLAALALLVQVRFLRDVAAASLGAEAVWVAGSIGLAAFFLERFDRRPRPASDRQRIGAIVGLSAGVLLQAGLLISSAAGGDVRLICTIVAIALQLPIVALTCVVFSRQRRLFAHAGGRAREYLRNASAGAGSAVLLYFVVMQVQSAPLVLLTAALGVCAFGVVRGIDLCKRAGNQLRWAATGIGLICSLGVGILGSIHAAHREVGPVRCGVWLTAVRESKTTNPSQSIAGIMPVGPRWRSERIDDLLGEILSNNKGRWLLAVTSRRDLPKKVPNGVHATISAIDPTAILPEAWQDGFVVAFDSGFFDSHSLDRKRYDGVMLSLAPAWSQAAWRCYNDRAIRRFLRRRGRGGVVILRLQADEESLDVALSTAKAIGRAIGDCWIALDAKGKRADLLLVGPSALISPPDGKAGESFISTHRIWEVAPKVRPINVLSPRAKSSSGLSIRALVELVNER